MQDCEHKRIWELDFLRGFCILCVLAVHFIFDLTYFGGKSISTPLWFSFVKNNGGVIFILLSGICVTLGHKSAFRGSVVLGCGFLITAVTVGMYKLGFADRSILIQFGVLHLLGASMLLYPLYRKWPLPAVAAVGILLIVLGYWFNTFTVRCDWIFILGLRSTTFSSSDYFPLLPHMGWFMLGSVLGKTVYREKASLLPRVRTDILPIRFFSWCGKQSLWIYLLHQPILYLIVLLLTG